MNNEPITVGDAMPCPICGGAILSTMGNVHYCPARETGFTVRTSDSSNPPAPDTQSGGRPTVFVEWGNIAYATTEEVATAIRAPLERALQEARDAANNFAVLRNLEHARAEAAESAIAGLRAERDRAREDRDFHEDAALNLRYEVAGLREQVAELERTREASGTFNLVTGWDARQTEINQLREQVEGLRAARQEGPCQFTATDGPPCGHGAESHGVDQDTDLDGRGKGPEYLVCFECSEEERPHWSHDFDGGPDLRELLHRYYIYEKEIDGAEQLERTFGPPEFRGSSISEEAWLERVLREPARTALGLLDEQCADCGGPPHFQGMADDHPYRPVLAAATRPVPASPSSVVTAASATGGFPPRAGSGSESRDDVPPAPDTQSGGRPTVDEALDAHGKSIYEWIHKDWPGVTPALARRAAERISKTDTRWIDGFQAGAVALQEARDALNAEWGARRDDWLAARDRDLAGLREQVEGLRGTVQTAIRDLTNYAAHIDDSGGSGGDALRDSARYLQNELDRAPAATRPVPTDTIETEDAEITHLAVSKEHGWTACKEMGVRSPHPRAVDCADCQSTELFREAARSAPAAPGDGALPPAGCVCEGHAHRHGGDGMGCIEDIGGDVCPCRARFDRATPAPPDARTDEEK